MSGWAPSDEADPRRDAIEIRCPNRRCNERAYRSDGDKLQTLLMKIVTDEGLLAAVTMWADDGLIVMRLSALHSARDTCKEH